MSSIPRVYRALRRRFGPQGWWPVTPPGGGTPRYHPGRFPRLSERQKVEIAFGAILTQNTAWTNAARAVEGLGAARGSLKRVDDHRHARLGRLIRSSGYFRQKAAKLKGFARHVLRRHRSLGGWLKGDLAAVRAELLELRGVGPETADSILLYAGGRPVFVVDAYTRRIGNRYGILNSEDYETVRAAFEAALEPSVETYQEYHALLVELAKRHCHKRDPECAGCPLKRGCAYAGGKDGKEGTEGTDA